MPVRLHLQELCGVVELAHGQGAVPGEGGDVGDGVLVIAQEAALGEMAIEHVELSLHLHGVTVDRIFVLLGSVGVKVAKATAEVGRAAHLPHQPGIALRSRGGVGGQECRKFLGEIQQDGRRLENPHRFTAAAIEQGRYLGVGVDVDKTVAKLRALLDIDRPGVVLGSGFAQGEQFLEQDGDFHAVRRGQGIELKRMLSAWQLRVVGGAGKRSIDARKFAAAGGVPGPHLGRFVTRVRHRWRFLDCRQGVVGRMRSIETGEPCYPACAEVNDNESIRLP